MDAKAALRRMLSKVVMLWPAQMLPAGNDVRSDVSNVVSEDWCLRSCSEEEQVLNY